MSVSSKNLHKHIWILVSGVILLFSSVVLPLSNPNLKEFQQKPSTSSTDFTYGTYSDVYGFDPLSVYDSMSGMIILNTFEGLFGHNYYTEELEVIPRLASNLGTWNGDMTEWTIPLRTDVTWWDGSRFTASDAVWNLQRINALSDASLCDHSSLWFTNEGSLIMQSIQATGTYEVTITLSKPWTDIMQLLSFSGASFIKPIAGYETALVSKDDYNILIGTGPFMVDSYVSGEKIHLIANENYRLGAPSIPEIIFKIFSDSNALTNALIGEEIHMARSISTDRLPEVEIIPYINTDIVAGSCKYFFHMSDMVEYDVRKALQFAYNYTQFLQEYVQNVGFQSTHPIPIGMEGYNPDLPGLPYMDLTIARNYLLNSADVNIQAAIAANGLSITNSTLDWRIAAEGPNPIGHYNFTSYGTSMYDQFAENAKDIGIRIDHEIIGDWPQFLLYANEHPGEMDFSYGGWCPDYYDPVNMLEHLFVTGASSNWNGLANATIDANIASLHSLTGSAKADMVDTVVQQVIVEQAHALYYMQSARIAAWNSEIILDGTSEFFNIADESYFYVLSVDHQFFDSDHDGITDLDETSIYHTDPKDRDSDDDGLEDGEEIFEHFTNPNSPDSDQDGYADFIEVICNTNPNDDLSTPIDSDGDGLYDGIETHEDFFGTDPYNPDTDGDGFTDYEEVWGGPLWENYMGESDPLDPNSYPIDRDGDKLSDEMELLVYNTNFMNLDTDQDGLTDGEEVKTYKSDPNNPDTDNDGLLDGDEVSLYFTDPVLFDTDNDNLNDNFEIKLGTNPLIDDTDGDGFYDGIEVQAGSSPLDANDTPESDDEDDDDDDSSAPDDDDDNDDNDDSSDDDSGSPFSNLFNSIPGYSMGLILLVSFLSIGIILRMKRK